MKNNIDKRLFSSTDRDSASSKVKLDIETTPFRTFRVSDERRKILSESVKVSVGSSDSLNERKGHVGHTLRMK